MAGTFTGDTLASGLVSNALGTIYTVPGSTVAFIKKVTFYNTSATPQTVVLYVRADGANDRQLRQWVLNQGESAEYGAIQSGAADLLRAESTTNGVVAYTVQGALET
jgi:hypothetical protein